MVCMVIMTILVMISMGLNSITENKCANLCVEKGAVTFDKIPNGKYNFKDACVCYYSEGSEAFILEG